MNAGVGVRSIEWYVDFPADTFEGETKTKADVLAKFYGYRPPR
jgi:hypothetical protein